MKALKYFLFFICASGFSQSVLVEDATRSASDLANILMNGTCVQLSNARISSEQSVAYFNNRGGAFPISEGVVIRAGKATFSEGSYTGLNLNSQINTNTDPYLEQINIDSGQSPIITDVAYLEFEFVPLSGNFNFDFLFASNEYGQWQCVSSDVFAFLLTDLVTGTTTNLAVIPGEETPISVKNIKDSAYNSTCGSDHADLFATYNVNDPASSTINMRGHTVVMNASAPVVAGNTYRIRLVIGDSNDAQFDSAIFLSAESFDADFDLGPDRMICDGDVQTIDTGLDPSIYTHQWTFNGTAITGAAGNSIPVSQTGTYGVSITKNNTNCLLADQVVFTDLMIDEPQDIVACNQMTAMHAFDLTQNNATALGISEEVYDILYYASPTDIASQNPIPTANLTNYDSPAGQSVYIKIFNTQTNQFCNAVYSFDLLVNDAIILEQPPALNICASSVPEVDLTQNIAPILNGQNPEDFNFSFFNTLLDAQNNTSPISVPTNYTLASDNFPHTIWVRVEDASTPECFDIVDFDIFLYPPPPVDELEDVIECSGYTLPPLTHGQYFTEPNGAGQHLLPGDIIEESGTYYIFNGPDNNGCTNESSFNVTLVDEFDMQTTYCGDFSIPSVLIGGFFSGPGGPGGSGIPLPPGVAHTISQTIYYYAEVNGVFCRDTAFDITVLPLPPVDDPADVVTCDQYVLPPLTHGNYFTNSNGNGTQLSAGDVITSSRDIYVFSDDGVCTNQNAFRIAIVPEFADQVVCGEYLLPSVEVGGYFTQTGGNGQQIPEGTAITTSQTIYYFAQTTSSPNCTENISFEVEVNPIPEVDDLEDALLCEGETYKLPPLVHGQYFTASDRGGEQLFPGNIIDVSQTIYINNFENGCANETVFSIEIRPLPLVENFTDIYTCGIYELPVLAHGSYFTQPGGNGAQLYAGDQISYTRTIYIYNTYDDLTTCFTQDSFTVYFIGVDLGEFEDISACDQYILPPLTIGNYYTESGGEGTPLFAGDIITTDQEIFVYKENGERFICTNETSFFVEISETPILDPFYDIESCGRYTLPELPQSDYNVAYYRAPNGQDEILPSEYTFTEPGVHTIYVYATSKTNRNCSDQAKFELTIHPLLELHIENGTICYNLETGEMEAPAILTSGLDPSEFEVNWYYNNNLVHTGVDYAASEPGVYTVKTVKLIPDVGPNCNYKPTTVMVLESAKPVVKVEMTQPFSDVAVVTVDIINGIGEYEFQLNNNGFQGSNEFYDVDSGAHTIRVRGINGNCGEAVVNIEVIKYPKFFTPNDDGHNDTWNIFDIWEHPEAKITVYDRYGKILTSFRPQSAGWNGLYNGRRMPSDDYWFFVEFEQNGVKEIFKSHFTLKR